MTNQKVHICFKQKYALNFSKNECRIEIDSDNIILFCNNKFKNTSDIESFHNCSFIFFLLNYIHISKYAMFYYMTTSYNVFLF